MYAEQIPPDLTNLDQYFLDIRENGSDHELSYEEGKTLAIAYEHGRMAIHVLRQDAADHFSSEMIITSLHHYPFTSNEDVMLHAVDDWIRALLEAPHTTYTRAELESLASNGNQARDQLIITHTHMVVSLAKRDIMSALPLNDRIQDGNEGLVHAMDKYDWRRGVKVDTYVQWWMRQSITRNKHNTETAV
ncbi:hypothetical protein C5B42_01025, partial [Candidatus Cerribacteria bacterium 'Amazon FNV 2010 28 9']